MGLGGSGISSSFILLGWLASIGMPSVPTSWQIWALHSSRISFSVSENGRSYLTKLHIKGWNSNLAHKNRSKKEIGGCPQPAGCGFGSSPNRGQTLGLQMSFWDIPDPRIRTPTWSFGLQRTSAAAGQIVPRSCPYRCVSETTTYGLYGLYGILTVHAWACYVHEISLYASQTSRRGNDSNDHRKAHI